MRHAPRSAGLSPVTGAGMSSAYAGERIALLTQHGKEQVLAPVLEPALGCSIVRVDGFDTDRLGTFTRDIPRPGTQRDAALRKARLGMELSGLPIGMASEGSFGPDPYVGMLPWNVEMLVLIDDRLGIEVTATAQAPGRSAHLRSPDWAELEAFARREGFPEHALVMRPHDRDDLRVRKGITTWPALETAFRECTTASPEGFVFVEHDLRAFANPTRMANIGNAARELLQRKGIQGYFAQVFGGDAFARKKPDPLPLIETCRALGTVPAATLMVGDSSNDAAAGHAAGCPVVLVTYGYNHGEPIRSVPAQAYIDRLDALPLS